MNTENPRSNKRENENEEDSNKNSKEEGIKVPTRSSKRLKEMKEKEPMEKEPRVPKKVMAKTGKKKRPMSKEEKLYPKVMPKRLSQNPQHLEDLYLKEPIDIESHASFNPEFFHYSLKKMIEDEALSLQLHFDTCWAMSVEQAIRFNAKLQDRIKLGEYSPRLSPQCLIDCLPAIYDLNHLDPWEGEGKAYPCNVEDALHLVVHRGMALETHVPYKGPYCGYKPYQSFGFIKRYFFVPLDWSDLCMAKVLATVGFLIGTFSCDKFLQNYKNDKEDFIYGLSKGFKTSGHCVLITGVGNTNGKSFFEVRNTFGQHWGREGYGFIDRELFTAIESIQEASITTIEAYLKSNAANQDFIKLMA
ncbi:uncharacterized protein LOC131634748 [Vicia villosa]|uniref:uncharacterized protein LOC131634748 n=1 Tax=Vicia villosa TaxID=3911 RepID=UPI00273A9210|nr:uncharacterized protein LOC131634748 [Vicia villosa]